MRRSTVPIRRSTVPMRRSTVLKALGAAGAAGVVATGVLVARSERARRAYTADEVRERLHERHALAVAADAARPGIPVEPWDTSLRARARRALRLRRRHSPGAA